MNAGSEGARMSLRSTRRLWTARWYMELGPSGSLTSTIYSGTDTKATVGDTLLVPLFTEWRRIMVKSQVKSLKPPLASHDIREISTTFLFNLSVCPVENAQKQWILVNSIRQRLQENSYSTRALSAVANQQGYHYLTRSYWLSDFFPLRSSK